VTASATASGTPREADRGRRDHGSGESAYEQATAAPAVIGVSGLLRPEMLVELEATAILPPLNY
jgi:enamine deaminase RidA (YjgF/YER057c/UK114 family)